MHSCVILYAVTSISLYNSQPLNFFIAHSTILICLVTSQSELGNIEPGALVYRLKSSHPRSIVTSNYQDEYWSSISDDRIH